LALDDPIQRYVPAKVKPPQFDGKDIALINLAEQNSGLPGLPSKFNPRDPANPYADYT